MSYALVRPGPARPRRLRPGHRHATRTWSAGWSPSGSSTPRRDAGRGSCGSRPASSRAMARIQRLRAGLALNYAALGLVIDLLDRIAELESALRRARRPGGRSWT